VSYKPPSQEVVIVKQLQKLYLKSILWLMPLPARVGWRISRAGDLVLETSAGLAMAALRQLGRLESEAQ
jgi:hypothetical protein